MEVYSKFNSAFVTAAWSAATVPAMASGTGASLVNNVWIADGSQAYTTGQNTGANFCYGLGSGVGSAETFYMQGTCPEGLAGSTLTVTQIQSDFAGYEAYAWVGLQNDGTTTVSATVTSVN